MTPSLPLSSTPAFVLSVVAIAAREEGHGYDRGYDHRAAVATAVTPASSCLRRARPRGQPPLLRGSARDPAGRDLVREELQRRAQKEIEFCHTFFGMEDGSALAFFQFADPEMYELCQAERPPKIGRYDHIAFKAEPETYDELKRRLERAGENLSREQSRLLQVDLCRHRLTGWSSNSPRTRPTWRRSTPPAAPMRTGNWPAGWPATAAPTTSCAAALSDPRPLFRGP